MAAVTVVFLLFLQAGGAEALLRQGLDALKAGNADQAREALEAAARARGITLLLMDTRQGGEAERLCEALGYTRWGEVPGYARSANGELHTTVFYYRRL